VIDTPKSVIFCEATTPVMKTANGVGYEEYAVRSIHFLRDLLGFTVRDAAGIVEAVCGQRASSSASKIREVGDVDAMHAAIRARGGAPSKPEKVNWIKIRMFEIRDPDGHALWFGQSYDRPTTWDSRCTTGTCPVSGSTGIGSSYIENAGRALPGTARKGRHGSGRAGKPSLGTSRLRRAGPRAKSDHLRAAV
jgi:hypothetical protein